MLLKMVTGESVVVVVVEKKGADVVRKTGTGTGTGWLAGATTVVTAGPSVGLSPFVVVGPTVAGTEVGWSPFIVEGAKVGPGGVPLVGEIVGSLAGSVSVGSMDGEGLIREVPSVTSVGSKVLSLGACEGTWASSVGGELGAFDGTWVLSIGGEVGACEGTGVSTGIGINFNIASPNARPILKNVSARPL